MTTPLTKAVARLVTIGDTRYKIVMTANGVRLTEHGKRRGIEVTWSSLIALIETQGREVDSTSTTPETGVPKAITKDVAREIRMAVAALMRADEAFKNAGVLPPEILTDVASDPFHGRAHQEPDWFIEPLLTTNELASILRLPLASVRALPIKTVRITGEERYRQSIVRAYLIDQEAEKDRSSSLAPMIGTGTQSPQEHPYRRRLKSHYNR